MKKGPHTYTHTHTHTHNNKYSTDTKSPTEASTLDTTLAKSNKWAPQHTYTTHTQTRMKNGPHTHTHKHTQKHSTHTRHLGEKSILGRELSISQTCSRQWKLNKKHTLTQGFFLQTSTYGHTQTHKHTLTHTALRLGPRQRHPHLHPHTESQTKTSQPTQTPMLLFLQACRMGLTHTQAYTHTHREIKHSLKVSMRVILMTPPFRLTNLFLSTLNYTTNTQTLRVFCYTHPHNVTQTHTYSHTQHSH